MTRLILSLLCTITLTSCTMHVQDTSFLRAVSSGEIDSASAELPAGYSINTDQLPTADGNLLYRARFVHPDAKSTVIFFGGNASTVGKFAVSTAKELTRDWRPDLVFVDYRGYGQSSGTPTLDALSADALLIFDSEAKLARDSGKKVVVAGYSLGSVVAGLLLEKRSLDGAILITTVSNVPDMLERATLWYVKPFVNVTVDPSLMAVDNIRAVKTYTGPLLVIGAEKDSQTPVVLSQRVIDASATPASSKRLVIALGANHGDVLRSPESAAALRLFAADNGF